MATDRIERLCHEIRAAELTMKKDTAKRAFAFALMLGLLIWMGQTVISVSLLILFAVTETLFVWLTRRGPDDFASVPDFASLPMASMKIGMMVATVTAFMVPSVLMVTNVDLPIVLAGFVWWFCLATHIVNVYAATTYLLCILMAPVTLGLGAIVLVAKASNHHTASATDWGIMVTCLVSYIFILIDTMRRNSDSKRELLSAQVEANSRLRALEHLSNHDSLTGLLNRRAFDEKLTELLSEDPHDGNDVAVMIVDLDGFKPINDTYSHEAGDQVLQTIGRRLLQLCEETGIVARLGGDEFALAFGAMRSDRMAVRLANYLVREINRPIVFEDKDLTVAASVGVSLASVAGKSVEVLCSTADLAMYRAKTNRTGTAELFDPANFAKRATLEDRKVLSEALRSREIRPFYQPKIRLADGATIGFDF